MGLSRKRTKEFKRLRGEADALLSDQRDVLEHATRVVREASRQGGNYVREEVAPRVRDTYEDRVRPVVASGVSGVRSAAGHARDKVTDDVFPAVGTALGSAYAALESVKSHQVRDAVNNVSEVASKNAHNVSKTAKAVSKTASKKADALAKSANRLGVKAHLVQPPKSAGPGKYILIGVAVVAIAGVAYAAWQTLRADDDLWIDDESDSGELEPHESELETK